MASADILFSAAQYDPTPADVQLAARIRDTEFRTKKSGTTGWRVDSVGLFLDDEWETVNTYKASGELHGSEKTRRELTIDIHRLTRTLIVCSAYVVTHAVVTHADGASHTTRRVAFSAASHVRLFAGESPRIVTERAIVQQWDKAMAYASGYFPRLAAWARLQPVIR